MSVLQKLGISNLRNISSANISPSPSINILYGDNGSGKSSVLEAIYLLGMARSFRSSSQKPLVKHQEKECTVFTELSGGLTLGFNKVDRGGQETKVAGRKAENATELARCLPIQLLNTDTFKILEGSPKVRRHFLDWGVFHVEHRFIEQWRHSLRALKNRNSLLKQKASKSEIIPWTVELVKHAEEIDFYRGRYLQALFPELKEVLGHLLPLEELTLEYDRGWDKDTDLHAVLDQSFSRDLSYGYTVPGPQRADIKIKIGQHSAVDILSRGQQKLLVSALKIAQGCLLGKETQKTCVYLVDDLPAELDKNNRKKVCRLLEGLGSQIFISAVEKQALENCWNNEGDEKRLFHVKHGKISEEKMASR